MTKMKSWLTSGKFGIVVLFCVFLVVGLYFLWMTLGMKEGLYVTIPDNTTAILDKAVDEGKLANLNDIPNPNAPMVISNKAPRDTTGSDPEFPLVGSIMQCAVDDINGNGTYYMVGSTNPKTINPFPNSDPSVIDTWSQTWATAPSFNNCTAFQRGPTMERQTTLPDEGKDVNCLDEDGDKNQHTYRVVFKNKIKKIQPFPGYEEDPDQVVAKSWDVLANRQNIENCKNIPKPTDANGNVVLYKYNLKNDELEGKLVKCLQTAHGSSQNRVGYHNRNNSIYKVENKLLRWYQSRYNAYTEEDNFNSHYPSTEKEKVIGVPSCDNFLMGENIAYKGDIRKLSEGTYTKCSIDVPLGAGVGQVYKVVDKKLSWTVSNEIASFLDPNFSSISRSINYYPDCSKFERGNDITKSGDYYKDFTTPGNYTLKIPPGCTGIQAITVGGGGGGGGGCGGWQSRNHEGGGGGGGGGGAGAVVFFNGIYNMPINDGNRNSSFKVIVGTAGSGGRRGDRQVDGGNNTAGVDGGNSYVASIAPSSNTETRYFEAEGGRGGGRGKFAKDYRGDQGVGGSGGKVINPDNYGGYAGNDGTTYLKHNNPNHDVGAGTGGTTVNVPAEVPEKDKYGKGGDGGIGSASWVDHAGAGTTGTNGFVRVRFIFQG